MLADDPSEREGEDDNLPLTIVTPWQVAEIEWFTHDNLYFGSHKQDIPLHWISLQRKNSAQHEGLMPPWKE